LGQAELHEFIDDLQLGLGELHQEIASAWFLPPTEQEVAA
jgi:hypothetical protein